MTKREKLENLLKALGFEKLVFTINGRVKNIKFVFTLIIIK